MNNFIKVAVLAIIGGVISGLIRYVTYQMYKGTIEFDGPALLSFWLSIASGAVLFSIIGAVLIAKKKL